MAAARALAINGDLTDRFGQTLADEDQKAGGEQVRPDPVHHHSQPVGAGLLEQAAARLFRTLDRDMQREIGNAGQALYDDIDALAAATRPRQP